MALSFLRFLGALSLVAAITAVYSALVHVNSTTVALTLLMGVLAIATTWGLAEAVAASAAAMLSFNFFFLPPVGTFTIEDPQNWVALAAFLVTAVVGSQLSASAKKRASEAIQRQGELERLYTLSRALMLADLGQDPARQVAQTIAQTFEVWGVALYDRHTEQVYRAGAVDIDGADRKLRDVAIQNTELEDVGAAAFLLPIRIGGDPIGSIAISGITASDTALHSIANLAAIALERARGLEAASRAEAARQSEELKSAMLDALAHEFKTPLTSIKAGITSLLSDPSTAPAHQELLRIVDEETDRLTSMVTEAIQMARIEAGQIELRKAPQSIAGLIRQSLAKLAGRLESRPVEVRVSDELPPVAADPELVRIVIRQLVDNAARYSPPDAPITIRAEQQGDAIVVGVADRGPGIPEPDRHRIFEKFYRGRDARRQIPGSGMGLAIAREIIRAHSGDIRVESRPGQGSEFLFSLPVARKEA